MLGKREYDEEWQRLIGVFSMLKNEGREVKFHHIVGPLIRYGDEVVPFDPSGAYFVYPADGFIFFIVKVIEPDNLAGTYNISLLGIVEGPIKQSE